jgi:cytochrome c553
MACTPSALHGGSAAPSGSALPRLIPLRVSAPPKQPKALQAFMTDHYFITAWARTQVMVGDLTGLPEPLQSLADYKSDAPELERWKPWLSRLQSAAAFTATARTLDLAATGVANMGLTCGECHRATGGGPPVLPTGAIEPSAIQSPVARMRMHSRAADRLWDGLTTPSDDAWEIGAASLAGMSVDDAERKLHPGYAREFAKLKTLGQSAQGLQNVEARAQLYGELLATCGHCHVKSQVRFMGTHSAH